jgi:imidazolonepropionase-like amidohydrolase
MPFTITTGPVLFTAHAMANFSLIINANVVDVETGTVLPRQAIRISRGRIDCVSASAPPPSAEILDAEGAYVCPGLIDGHVHLFLDAGADPLGAFLGGDTKSALRIARTNAARALSAGITTIRDCGGPADLVFRFQLMVEMGEVSGPRILSAGAPLTRVGGHCHFFGGEVATTREVRLAVVRQARKGAAFVKLIASGGGLTPGTRPSEADLPLDLMREAVAVARATEMHVAAHCHATESITRALLAKVDIIEHASFVDPDGQARFNPEIAQRMKDQGTVVSPTVISGLRIAQNLRKSANTNGLDHAAINRLEARRDHVARFYEAGVRILAGSDCGVAGTPFDSLLDELIEYANAGIPAAAALRSATSDSALCLGQPDLGQVKPGYHADLLFLSENPLENLAALKESILVMRKGDIVCDRREVPVSR